MAENKVVAQVGYEEAYKLLTEFQSVTKEGQTIAQFDHSIEEFFKNKKCTFSQAMQSVSNGIKKDDESYDFIMKTLEASNTELDPGNKQSYVISDTEVNYIDSTGGEGKMKLTSKIMYTITDRKKITVQDRDEKIEEYKKCINNFANQMIMENVKEDEVREQIESRMKDWSTRLSNDKITFKARLEDLKLE